LAISELALEKLLIEEQQGTEGLILGARGHLPVGRQMREKGTHFGLAHFCGMPFAVKNNELPHPAQIGLFRPNTVMAQAQCAAHLIEKFGLAEVVGR